MKFVSVRDFRLKPPAKILRLVLQRNLQIVVNEHILSEYYEVLKRPKFNFDLDKVQVVTQFIRKIGVKAPALALKWAALNYFYKEVLF